MTRPNHILNGLCLLFVGLVWGCAEFAPVPPPSSPFFTVEAGDAKTLQNLGRRQEALLDKCGETNSCDHAYFTRALAALFENREIAAKYFSKVIAVSPKSHLAASSKEWLRLLQTTSSTAELSWVQTVLTAPTISSNHAALTQATERLVRDLLDREVVIQQLRAMKGSDSQTVEGLQRELLDRDKKLDAQINKREAPRPAADPNTVQALQKQLSDRNKRIEELTGQLEALKRIDQEMREKIRPIKPPVTTFPSPSPEIKP